MNSNGCGECFNYEFLSFFFSFFLYLKLFINYSFQYALELLTNWCWLASVLAAVVGVDSFNYFTSMLPAFKMLNEPKW